MLSVRNDVATIIQKHNGVIAIVPHNEKLAINQFDDTDLTMLLALWSSLYREKKVVEINAIK